MQLSVAVANAIAKVDELVALVKGQYTKWDNQVKAKTAELENWKTNFLGTTEANKLRSHARLHPSCTLESMLIPFSQQYSVGGWLTIEKVQTVSGGIAWEDRTVEEKELLAYMGRSGVMHFSPAFDIVKLTWTSRSGHNLPHVHANLLRNDSYITSAAYVKHLTGEVPYGHYCSGLKANSGWQLCGTHYRGGPHGYAHPHPYTSGEEGGGSVLIALPATVDRFVDLKDPKNWGGILGV